MYVHRFSDNNRYHHSTLSWECTLCEFNDMKTRKLPTISHQAWNVNNSFCKIRAILKRSRHRNILFNLCFTFVYILCSSFHIFFYSTLFFFVLFSFYQKAVISLYINMYLLELWVQSRLDLNYWNEMPIKITVKNFKFKFSTVIFLFFKIFLKILFVLYKQWYGKFYDNLIQPKF